MQVQRVMPPFHRIRVMTLEHLPMTLAVTQMQPR